MGASLSQGLTHGLALMTAKVVHDDDVAGRQGGDQDLLDIGQEPLAVDRSVQDEGGGDLVAAQGGQEGHGFPVAVRDLGHQPLAAGATAVGAGHVGLGPGLVDEDQAARIKPGLMALPARPLPGHVRTVLLGAEQAFF